MPGPHAMPTSAARSSSGSKLCCRWTAGVPPAQPHALDHKAHAAGACPGGRRKDHARPLLGCCPAASCVRRRRLGDKELLHPRALCPFLVASSSNSPAAGRGVQGGTHGRGGGGQWSVSVVTWRPSPLPHISRPRLPLPQSPTHLPPCTPRWKAYGQAGGGGDDGPLLTAVPCVRAVSADRCCHCPLPAGCCCCCNELRGWELADALGGECPARPRAVKCPEGAGAAAGQLLPGLGGRQARALTRGGAGGGWRAPGLGNRCPCCCCCWNCSACSASRAAARSRNAASSSSPRARSSSSCCLHCAEAGGAGQRGAGVQAAASQDTSVAARTSQHAS